MHSDTLVSCTACTAIDQGDQIYVLSGTKIQKFNADGIYLYRTELDFVPKAVKNGFLYRIESDEDTGSLKVIRYRINNWDEIRASMS